jgi:hypothetical protein
MRFLRIIILISFGANLVSARTTQFHGTFNEIRQLDGAVDQYQMEHKRPPTEAEGLALVAEYVKGGRIPMDLWGNPYVYRSPGVHGTNGYEIFSMGADGRSKSGGNDRDDINLWDDADTQREKSKYYDASGRVWGRSISFVVGFGFLCTVLWLIRNAIYARRRARSRISTA